MERIRLLTSVQGDDGVHGDVGDELDVPEHVARVWADGTRAELVSAAALAAGSATARRRVRGTPQA